MERPIAINVNLSTSGSRLGGAAIAAEFHCRYMAAESFPMELWRMWDKDEEFYLDSLKIRNFHSKVKSSIPERLLPKRAKKLLLDSDILSEIDVYNPEIIHLHNPIPSLAFQRIVNYARTSGKKAGASTHGFYEILHPNYGLKPYEKFIWNKTITEPVVKSVRSLDFICSLYPEEKQMLVDMGLPEEKIYLTPNGVNPFFLEPSNPRDEESLKEKFNLSADLPIVLFIGNHTANKGIDTVMEIASKLSHPATFVIGGKLLSANEPQQWQERFPKGDRIEVIFTDYLTVAEQRALYRLANILLFPSLADTLPLTILEAMATGLPVIAYDVGGISYQLQDGCGSLITIGDFTGFLNAVEQLISNPELRTKIAKKAKLRQEAIFSWERTARTTIDMYKQIIDPN